ncbi:DUF5605 domain-containing protein [Streptomyces sp. NPDC048291]|uniref:DUF5605 domain-containing protein n=1 Tax=Streptomyces sp. NPDC048291 TaxID=3365530 RepID=UPI0037210168
MFDEVKYEGDIPEFWGSITAQELVHRFWQATVAGTYVTHGETLKHPEDVLWWSKGGELHGESPARIAFLKEVLDEAPAAGLEPQPFVEDPLHLCGGSPDHFLRYFGRDTPAEWPFAIPQASFLPEFLRPLVDGMEFRVEILDTWNMTVTPVEETFTLVVDAANNTTHDRDHRSVKLPGLPCLALRIKRVQP